MNEEFIWKASMLERQSQETQNKIEFVNQQIAELMQFQDSLNYFNDSDQKQILASLGKGVYVKANLENKDLFVEVGSGVIVKKKSSDMNDIINDQIRKFTEVRTHLIAEFESYNKSLQSLVKEIEEANKSKS